MTNSDRDLRYKKSINRKFNEIKCHVPFIDETFAIASSVRQQTKIKHQTLLENIVLPKSERTLIQSEMRTIRRSLNRKKWLPINDGRYVYLTRKLRDADEKIKILKGIYTRILPLSPKLIIQYKNEKHARILSWFDSLPDSERKKVKIVHDGQLINYEAGIKPEGTFKLCTQLKPYFLNQELSPDMMLIHLDKIKRQLQTSISNTIKNRQHLRRREAEYKHRKLEHFISVVTRLGSSKKIYGKIIKGVKSHIKLDDKLFTWPQYLIGKFESVRSGVLTFNSSILSEHTVIIPASGEVPIVSFGALHIFCKDNKETLNAMALLTDHESNKFKAFSHYENSMSREYPIKNSIAFPSSY